MCSSPVWGWGRRFPPAAPEPQEDPPPFRRWRERWGPDLDRALAGEIPEVLEGEGGLLDRHRAWSEARAEALILGPAKAAAERKRQAEAARMDRLAQALARDRAKHLAVLPLKVQAQRLAAELYRLKGATRRGGAAGWRSDPAARREERRWRPPSRPGSPRRRRPSGAWSRVAELEAELARERAAWAKRMEAESGGLAPEPPPARQPNGEGAAKGQGAPKGKGTKRMQAEGKRKDGKGVAFRSVMVDGFEVLIGKGDAENDQLTFKVADNTDFWLHVASVPGSHVVIRNPDKLSELPRHVLERAAELAAYHSKARDGGKVEVHLARIADISKPRGFAPGKVILKKWIGIRVYPKP